MSDFRKVTKVGACIMAASFSLMLCTILISFPLAHKFSLIQQAIAHVLTIVLAGFFKVGYVAFIVGKYERKLPF